MGSDVNRKSIWEYLHQDSWWITSDKGPVKISDMTGQHKALAARWLINHATPLLILVEAYKHEDVMTGDETLSGVLNLMSQSPRKWVENTPLYRALTAMEAER